MDVIDTAAGREADFVALFTDTFAASEGEAEGRLVGALVHDQITRTPAEDLRVFAALDRGALIGAIVFSRLRYAEESRLVFILSPVAVTPGRQGEGVGQTLIRAGLDALALAGVDVAVTYGDPDYYARVGFRPVSEAILPAPFALKHPHGWLAQSLTDEALAPLRGPCGCVGALNRSDYW